MTWDESLHIILRPVAESDLPAVKSLAVKAGVGMTSLPQDECYLHAKIARACQSFSKKVTSGADELYFFVLEDCIDQKVVGCCAIEANTGFHDPFYSFKLSTHKIYNQQLNLQKDVHSLLLCTDKQNCSEVCTLYLLPEYRRGGIGQFLSRARFLWMADHPQRLCEMVIAEMRGMVDKNGTSPFWNHLGRRFVELPFSQADALVAKGNKQFISDLMPRSPIYVDLLPKVAQQVIGSARRSTRPAVKLLEREGFRCFDYVDIFDAGPTLECPLNRIATVQNSQVAPVVKLSNRLGQPHAMITNTKLEVRATFGGLRLEGDGVKISHKTADLLQIDEGDLVRFVFFGQRVSAD